MGNGKRRFGCWLFGTAIICGLGLGHLILENRNKYMSKNNDQYDKKRNSVAMFLKPFKQLAKKITNGMNTFENGGDNSNKNNRDEIRRSERANLTRDNRGTQRIPYAENSLAFETDQPDPRNNLSKPTNDPEIQIVNLKQQQEEIQLKQDALKQKLEDCWTVQLEYRVKEAIRNAYISLFEGDTGLFRYMQRLLGYSRYEKDLPESEQEQQYRELLSNGLLVILKRYEQKIETIKGIDYSNEKTNYLERLNIKFDLSTFEQEDLRLTKIIERNRSDLDELEKTTARYEKLYHSCSKSLEQLSKWDELSGADKVKGLENSLMAISAAFEQKDEQGHCDVHFIFYDQQMDAKSVERWFRVLDSADCCPAVVNGDGQDVDDIIFKGKITPKYMN